MKPEAIHHARERLKKAENAVASLRSAKNLDAAEAAWVEFLIAANSIYSKLENGAKGGGRSEAWFGRMKHDRKNDELLNYIHHARNVDEHGIERITEKDPGYFAITGDMRLDGTIGPGQTLRVTQIPGGRPVGFESKPTRLKLIPVTDHWLKNTFPV